MQSVPSLGCHKVGNFSSHQIRSGLSILKVVVFSLSALTLPFWSATGASGWPLEQISVFAPVADQPITLLLEEIQIYMNLTLLEIPFQELSNGIRLIFLSHIEAQLRAKNCAKETTEMSEMSGQSATGALLYGSHIDHLRRTTVAVVDISFGHSSRYPLSTNTSRFWAAMTLKWTGVQHETNIISQNLPVSQGTARCKNICAGL